MTHYDACGQVRGGIYRAGTIPDSVSETKFAQILEVLTLFLVSEQAKDELSSKNLQEMQTLVDEVRKLGHKTGWDKIREFLIASSAVTTLVLPILRPIIGG